MLALAVPLTVISVLGLLLNGYILLVVVLTKQLQSVNNLLLLHLGVVDSLLCIVFLLFSAPVLLRGPAASAQGGAAGPLCALHGFLFSLLHPVALWTVCGLNCDRYYAISAPLHYTSLVNTKKVAICLAASWILALAMALPPLFITGPGYRYSEPAGCTLHFTAPLAPAPTVAVWYSGLYTLFTLLVPAALILGCNLKVLMIARYHRHRIASAIYEVTLSAQVTITHQRNPFYLQSQFKGRRAIVTVLQLLGSLLVLYFPYYGVIVWEAAASTLSSSNSTGLATEIDWQPQQSPGHVNPIVVYLAMALITCSPPINGFIYGVKSKVLRKTFANFWRKQMTKSEVNHEIQARTPSACGSRRPSLTPLGQFLGRPNHQRRLSEVLLEPTGRFALSPHRPRLLKRMATELSWRPTLLAAATAIDLDAKMRRSRSARDCIAEMRHGLSCNTLQVPGDQIEPLPPLVLPVPKRQTSPPKLRQSASAASLLVQRVLLAPKVMRASNTARPRTPPPQRCSPQILITRALSQDQPDSPSKRQEEQEPDDSSTAALIQTGGCSNPESLCESSPSSRDESLNMEMEATNPSLSKASQRICFSLDDVSSGKMASADPATANSDTTSSQQPLSLPTVPVAQNGNAVWFRTLIFARHKGDSSKNLMSWPIRTDLSKRSVTKSTKRCCDVNSQENII